MQADDLNRCILFFNEMIPSHPALSARLDRLVHEYFHWFVLDGAPGSTVLQIFSYEFRVKFNN